LVTKSDGVGLTTYFGMVIRQREWPVEDGSMRRTAVQETVDRSLCGDAWPCTEVSDVDRFDDVQRHLTDSLTNLTPKPHSGHCISSPLRVDGRNILLTTACLSKQAKPH